METQCTDPGQAMLSQAGAGARKGLQPLCAPCTHALARQLTRRPSTPPQQLCKAVQRLRLRGCSRQAVGILSRELNSLPVESFSALDAKCSRSAHILEASVTRSE